MAFSSDSGDGAPMAEINIIPLADVMLVLLIIFMVTSLRTSYPIDIDLPQRTVDPPEVTVDPPPPIELRIDGSGEVFWNNSPVPISSLRNMMEAEVERDPSNQPTLQIDANEEAHYGVLARVLAEAKNAHMQKIGFLRK